MLCLLLGSRSYSVMVITKDFESFDPGSSPGRTFCNFLEKVRGTAREQSRGAVAAVSGA